MAEGWERLTTSHSLQTHRAQGNKREERANKNEEETWRSWTWEVGPLTIRPAFSPHNILTGHQHLIAHPNERCLIHILSHRWEEEEICNCRQPEPLPLSLSVSMGDACLMHDWQGQRKDAERERTVCPMDLVWKQAECRGAEEGRMNRIFKIEVPRRASLTWDYEWGEFKDLSNFFW